MLSKRMGRIWSDAVMLYNDAPIADQRTSST